MTEQPAKDHSAAQDRTRGRGELELEILRILWNNDVPLTGKEILQVFPGKVPAYTTVLTALDRLRAKGDVVRVGEAARGIRFAAARSEAEHTGRIMLNALDVASDRSAALLKLAGSLDPDDVDVLREALTPKPPRERRGK